MRISEWPFGSSSVRISIETGNGYRDSTSVNTAVSGTPSHTFNIPQNQGNSDLYDVVYISISDDNARRRMKDIGWDE